MTKGEDRKRMCQAGCDRGLAEPAAFSISVAVQPPLIWYSRVEMTLARRMVARLVQITNASIDLYRIGHFRTAREAAKLRGAISPI